MRLLLAAFALALVLGTGASAQTPPSELVVDGIRFGPPIRLEGVYGTNWENSTFSECVGGDCSLAAWVMCDPSACEDLEARLKALNGGHDNPASFTVVFQARRSIGKTAKRFLHDREDKIYLERIERFELRPR